MSGLCLIISARILSEAQPPIVEPIIKEIPGQR